MFTLDPGVSAAVVAAFKQLHERGLVYRSHAYMIHWSPALQTALSDLEVEYREEEGALYTFKYFLSGPGGGGVSGEYIPIATTRPETILGDTAVCVHPEDSRYRHLIGRTCRVPFQERDIPVIADPCVDREYGTGALKVTPGHDGVDYDLARRHGLPVINILHKDATINHMVRGSGCIYVGMQVCLCGGCYRVWCRPAVIPR